MIVVLPVPALLQLPPVVAELSSVLAAIHTLVFPVIAAGSEFTVTCAVALQPSGSVYMMFAVPVFTDVTLPDASTVAMLTEPDAHVPPADELVSIEERPLQIASIPPIVAGVGFTVAFLVL